MLDCSCRFNLFPRGVISPSIYSLVHNGGVIDHYKTTIDHYCGRFECKMRRVGQILTKLSIAENFKEWTFGQFAWIIGLVTLRYITLRTYLQKNVYYGCF